MIGPKKVECIPIANSARNISGIARVPIWTPLAASSRPVAPTDMMMISANLIQRMMVVLLRMSASWPEVAENSTKGSTNSAVAIPLTKVSVSGES